MQTFPIQPIEVDTLRPPLTFSIQTLPESSTLRDLPENAIAVNESVFDGSVRIGTFAVSSSPNDDYILVSYGGGASLVIRRNNLFSSVLPAIQSTRHDSPMHVRKTQHFIDGNISLTYAWLHSKDAPTRMRHLILTRREKSGPVEYIIISMWCPLWHSVLSRSCVRRKRIPRVALTLDSTDPTLWVYNGMLTTSISITETEDGSSICIADLKSPVEINTVVKPPTTSLGSLVKTTSPHEFFLVIDTGVQVALHLRIE